MEEMTEAIHRFAIVARAYRLWATSRAVAPHAELLEARRLLVALYAAAIALPEGRVGDERSPAVSNEEWQAVLRAMAKLPFQHYGSVFDPTVVAPQETTLGDIADDLADIYRDIVDGLAFYDAGDLDGATWHWRFLFEAHWGEHATDAIRVLHGWITSAAVRQELRAQE